MLNILTSQNLSNVLVIVTRYFGGILLGTGGLVKAYTKATMEGLNNINIIEKDLGLAVQFIVNYCDLEKLKYYFKQNEINLSSIEYEENVSANVEIAKEKLNKIIENKENLNFKIIEYKVIKEKFIVI